MKSYGQYCGLARALDHVGDRWTLLIIRELLPGPKRFVDLRERLGGVAANLLAARLRRLEADRIVTQDFLEPPAARNVYALTELGRGLREPIEALIRWGGHWMEEGQGDDAFETEWLGLAFGALGVGGTGPTRVIEFEVGAQRTLFSVGTEGVRAVTPHGERPEFSVRGDAALLFGLAVGAVPMEQDQAKLTFTPDTEAVRRGFRELILPPRADREA